MSTEPESVERAVATAIEPIDPLGEYKAAAEEYIRAARSTATLRAYRADWRDFSAWCAAHELAALPAEPETVALYLSALAKLGRHAGTIGRRATTIGLVHQRQGLASPSAHRMVREALRGIRRKLGTRQRGKLPATLDLIRKAIEHAEGSLASSRDRALLLVGFAGGLRRSELAALRVEDLHAHKHGITLELPTSKTDQEGQGREVEIPYGAQPESTPLAELTCPVRALTQWLKLANINDGPVFRHVTAAQTIHDGLSTRAIGEIVKRAFARAGLDEKDLARYGAHSLRAGFATEAYQNGASELAIMRQTGHKSSAMVRRYIRAEKADRMAAASKLGL
jgi:integrase